MADFSSRFSIGQEVEFLPMVKHTNAACIMPEYLYGTITAVRFTKAKVFYDLVDDYHGQLFENVESDNLKEFSLPTITE